MERIRLDAPGSELTLTITGVSREEIGGGSYYKFNDGKTELLVPAKSAEHQFERVGAANADMTVGKTIRFSRSAEVSKSGHPYWNLDLASPNGAGKPAATKQGRDYTPPQFRDELPAELREQDEYEQEAVSQIQNGQSPKVPMRQAYKGLTEWVLSDIAPLYEKAGIGLSPEAAAACTATLFIAAKNSGKIE